MRKILSIVAAFVVGLLGFSSYAAYEVVPSVSVDGTKLTVTFNSQVDSYSLPNTTNPRMYITGETLPEPAYITNSGFTKGTGWFSFSIASLNLTDGDYTLVIPAGYITGMWTWSPYENLGDNAEFQIPFTIGGDTPPPAKVYTYDVSTGQYWNVTVNGAGSVTKGTGSDIKFVNTDTNQEFYPLTYYSGYSYGYNIIIGGTGTLNLFQVNFAAPNPAINLTSGNYKLVVGAGYFKFDGEACPAFEVAGFTYEKPSVPATSQEVSYVLRYNNQLYISFNTVNGESVYGVELNEKKAIVLTGNNGPINITNYTVSNPSIVIDLNPYIESGDLVVGGDYTIEIPAGVVALTTYDENDNKVQFLNLKQVIDFVNGDVNYELPAVWTPSSDVTFNEGETTTLALTWEGASNMSHINGAKEITAAYSEGDDLLTSETKYITLAYGNEVTLNDASIEINVSSLPALPEGNSYMINVPVGYVKYSYDGEVYLNNEATAFVKVVGEDTEISSTVNFNFTSTEQGEPYKYIQITNDEGTTTNPTSATLAYTYKGTTSLTIAPIEDALQSYEITVSVDGYDSVEAFNAAGKGLLVNDQNGNWTLDLNENSNGLNFTVAYNPGAPAVEPYNAEVTIYIPWRDVDYPYDYVEVYNVTDDTALNFVAFNRFSYTKNTVLKFSPVSDEYYLTLEAEDFEVEEDNGEFYVTLTEDNDGFDFSVVVNYAKEPAIEEVTASFYISSLDDWGDPIPDLPNTLEISYYDLTADAVEKVVLPINSLNNASATVATGTTFTLKPNPGYIIADIQDYNESVAAVSSDEKTGEWFVYIVEEPAANKSSFFVKMDYAPVQTPTATIKFVAGEGQNISNPWQEVVIELNEEPWFMTPSGETMEVVLTEAVSYDFRADNLDYGVVVTVDGVDEDTYTLTNGDGAASLTLTPEAAGAVVTVAVYNRDELPGGITNVNVSLNITPTSDYDKFELKYFNLDTFQTSTIEVTSDNVLIPATPGSTLTFTPKEGYRIASIFSFDDSTLIINNAPETDPNGEATIQVSFSPQSDFVGAFVNIGAAVQSVTIDFGGVENANYFVDVTGFNAGSEEGNQCYFDEDGTLTFSVAGALVGEVQYEITDVIIMNGGTQVSLDELGNYDSSYTYENGVYTFTLGTAAAGFTFEFVVAEEGTVPGEYSGNLVPDDLTINYYEPDNYGTGTANLGVALKVTGTMESYKGFQFDITLPNFVSVTGAALENGLTSNASAPTVRFSEVSSDDDNTTWRVVAALNAGTTFTGELLKLSLSYDRADLVVGEYPVVVIDNTIFFSTPTGDDITTIKGGEGTIYVIDITNPIDEVEIVSATLHKPSYTYPNNNDIHAVTKGEGLDFVINYSWEEDLEDNDNIEQLQFEIKIGDDVTISGDDAYDYIEFGYDEESEQIYWVFNTAIEEIETESYNVLVPVVLTAFGKINNVSSSWSFTVRGVLPGDSNFSDEVNVADVVTTANYVAGLNSSRFDFPNAEVTNDDEITVADVTETVNLILDPSKKNVRGQQFGVYSSNDMLTIGNFNVRNDAPMSIAVELDNTASYSAIQAEVVVPEGMKVIGVTAGPRAADHRFISNVEGNTVKVVIYSEKNAEFAQSEGAIFNLEVVASEDCGNIEMRNIIAADARSNSYMLGYEGGENQTGTTGINGIDADNDGVRYFTVDGIEVFNPEKGQILIRVAGDKVEKVVVK